MEPGWREVGVSVTGLATFGRFLTAPLVLLFGGGALFGRRRFPFVVGRLGFGTREAFVQELGALLGLAGRVADPRPIEGVVFSGEPGGRRATLVFDEQDDGDSRVEQIARFELALPRAPSLKVTRATYGDRFKRFVTETAGGPAAPLPQDLAAEADPAAMRALRGRLALLVETLFQQYPARELRLGEDVLRAALPTRGLSGDSLRAFLAHLLEVAKVAEELCRGVRLQRARALGAETRCGYCHEVFPGEPAHPVAAGSLREGEDVVACELCSTVLHRACRDEHGGCPVLGCTGQAEERYRKPG